MQNNHQTQPDVDLEFDLVWATIWDYIRTEIFLREDASGAGWRLATSKIFEVADDPCEEGDDLFEEIRGVVANAQVDAWALMESEASNSVTIRSMTSLAGQSMRSLASSSQHLAVSKAVATMAATILPLNGSGPSGTVSRTMNCRRSRPSPQLSASPTQRWQSLSIRRTAMGPGLTITSRCVPGCPRRM